MGRTRPFIPLRMDGKEHLEGIVDRLEPGVEFFVQGAGQEAECIAHGDHGTADRHAVVLALTCEVETCGDGHECLASSGLAIAGDQ